MENDTYLVITSTIEDNVGVSSRAQNTDFRIACVASYSHLSLSNVITEEL